MPGDGPLDGTRVAIDESRFKAFNNRDRNVTKAKLERRREQIEESGSRYLAQLETADRQEPTPGLAAKVARLNEKIARFDQEMKRLAGLETQMEATPDRQVSLTDSDARSMAISRYWTNACQACPLKADCTTGKERRVTRWEHEDVLETVQRRLDADPQAMRMRRETVEHPFGTLKARMGATHFLTWTLPRV